jgi:hypothetical protein
MSKQPQEWTPEYVQGFFGWEDKASQIVSQRLADAHNAALAAQRAEKEAWKRRAEGMKLGNENYARELVSERKDRDDLAFRLNIAQEQLAAERKELSVIKGQLWQSEQQLAAERGKYQDARNLWNVTPEDSHKGWIQQMQETIDALVAEREKKKV